MHTDNISTLMTEQQQQQDKSIVCAAAATATPELVSGSVPTNTTATPAIADLETALTGISISIPNITAATTTSSSSSSSSSSPSSSTTLPHDTNTTIDNDTVVVAKQESDEKATIKTVVSTTLDEEKKQQEAQEPEDEWMETHRPGFYKSLTNPSRLKIQTAKKIYLVDRYCPHARADMLKWGVLRADNTLRCGVHYWGFDLDKGGVCKAHPDETLNACASDRQDLEW